LGTRDGQTCHAVSIVLHFFSPHPRFFLYFLLTILTLPVQLSHTRNSFHLGARYTFSCVLFCRRSSSGWCPLLSLYSRPGSTIFLTSNVHFSALLFWFESLYQSSLYRLNPNLPPTITLLYHAIVFLCQAVTASGNFAGVTGLSPASLTALRFSCCWHTTHPSLSLSEFQRFDTPIPLLLSVSLVLLALMVSRYLNFLRLCL